MLVYPGPQPCGKSHLCKPETVILHQYRSGDQSFIMHVFEDLHVLMEIFHSTTAGELVGTAAYVYHHVRNILDDHLVFHHPSPQIEVFLTEASAIVAGLHQLFLADDHRHMIHTTAGLHHLVDALVVQRQHTTVHDVAGISYEFCARESRCDPFANLKVTPLQVTFAKV